MHNKGAGALPMLQYTRMRALGILCVRIDDLPSGAEYLVMHAFSITLR